MATITSGSHSVAEWAIKFTMAFISAGLQKLSAHNIILTSDVYNSLTP